MLITQARKHGQHFEGNAISQNTNAQTNQHSTEEEQQFNLFKKNGASVKFFQ